MRSMRMGNTGLLCAMAVALGLGVPGSAAAKTIDWNGTLVLDLGVLGEFVGTGGGVATVNNSSGGSHLNTLRLDGGISVSGTVPVTDPESTATIVSVIVETAALGAGTFGNISGVGAVSPNKLQIGGLAKVCLFFSGCSTFLPLENNQGANTGIGLGGVLTLGAAGPIRISIEAAGWQLSSATRITQTDNGVFQTKMAVGFIHGPESNTSSTASGSGRIQLISPMQVYTSGLPNNAEQIALFASLTVHFVPEPGLMLLLASGVLGLALIGRSRMR